MILDTSGNVYGTNSGGGLYNGGTAFELIQSNGKWTLQVLIAFKPTKLGNVAPNGLILGKSGILYGSTYGGGAHFNGSIFELIPTMALGPRSCYSASTTKLTGVRRAT